MPPHSDLPIVRIDTPAQASSPAPALSTREKYGGLFYLGLAGLAFLLFLVGQFAYGVWSLRDHLAHVYRLHDPHVPDAERVQAAVAIAQDPRTTQRQLWDDCLDKSLPPLARYILAEALTPEVMANQPKSYAATVAKSAGWPDWLRLLLIRPLAYAASEGQPLPTENLKALAQHSDQFVRLWALYVLAVANQDSDAQAALASAAAEPAPTQAVAAQLLSATRAPAAARPAILARATLLQRTTHPQALALWKSQPPGRDH